MRSWLPPGGPAPDTAAVELLIEHDIWLRRRDFLDAAVHVDEDGLYWINFREARDVYDRGDVNRGSTTERAVLDLALSRGDDRYRLTQMGRVNSPRSRVRSAGRSRHDHAATGDSRRGRRSRRGTPPTASPYRVVDREHTGWWATAHAAQLRGEAAEPEVGSRRRPHPAGPQASGDS